jgi:hypothetical protein
VASALDREQRELAERNQIDRVHIGGQSRDFKLLALPLPWLGIRGFNPKLKKGFCGIN